MRKLVAGLAVVVLLLTAGGAVAVAQADDAKPDRDDAGTTATDDHAGACTSFFNGKKKGHGKGGRPHPARFQALLDAAGGDPAVVLQQCGGPDAIGGNPSKGRFPQLFD